MDGDSRMANERGVEERRGKEYMWTERNREEEERERERERDKKKSWTASFSDFPTQIESY